MASHMFFVKDFGFVTRLIHALARQDKFDKLALLKFFFLAALLLHRREMNKY